MERFVVELERYVLAQGRSVLLAEPFGCAVVAKARYCLKQRCLFLCREPDAKLLHTLVLSPCAHARAKFCPSPDFASFVYSFLPLFYSLTIVKMGKLWYNRIRGMFRDTITFCGNSFRFYVVFLS